MHTEKYQISQVAKVLSESDRSMYESHDGQYDKVSKSLIDYERTPYNYNLSDNNMSYSEVKSLNEKWRGCKVSPDDITLFGTVITLPKDFLPEMEGLTGKDLFDFIHENPEVEKQVNLFFKSAYDGLKEIYHLEEEDICSAWVHMDETTPHLHFYAIPHVRLQEKTEEVSIDTEKERLYHLSEEDPQSFYEEIKRGYIEKIQKYEEDLLKTTAPTKIASLERKKAKVQTDLDKLLALSPEAYAKRKHSRYASELGYTKKKKARTDTVSYETVVPLYVYKTQHKDLQEYVSERLGYEVHILNGKTRDIDFSKLDAEQKRAGLRKEQILNNADIFIKAQDDKMCAQGEQIAENDKTLTEQERKKADYEAFTKVDHQTKDFKKVKVFGKKETHYAVPEQKLECFCTAAYEVPKLKDEISDKDKTISDKDATIRSQADTIYSKNKEISKYKGYKEEKEQMIINFQKRLNKVKKSPFKDPSDMSHLIHEYVLLKVSNEKEKAAILKACEALDKLDAYQWRTVGYTTYFDGSFDKEYSRLQSKLKEEYMKILDYGGRAEMYDEINDIWTDSKEVSKRVWMNTKSSNAAFSKSVQSVHSQYEPLITGILSDLFSLVRMAFELIQEASYGYGGR